MRKTRCTATWRDWITANPGRPLIVLLTLCLAGLAFEQATLPAQATDTPAPMCQTALARIAKVEVQKLVDQQKGSACKKLNLFGFDKTKDLKLNALDICEDGPKVSAKVDFSFSCATGDGALLQATVGSNVKAEATVDFHSCAVDVAKLDVDNSTLQQAVDAIGGKALLSGYVTTLVKPYCDH